jgi:hypothetical protein
MLVSIATSETNQSKTREWFVNSPAKEARGVQQHHKGQRSDEVGVQIISKPV